jgi:hypothetical protein
MSFIEPARFPREARVNTNPSGRELHSRNTRALELGETMVGYGGKVMSVTYSHGLPIGFHMDSAQLHDIRLADQALETIRVLHKRGRPSTSPKNFRG